METGPQSFSELSRSTLEALPEEILIHIASFLPVNSLKKLGKVNHFFRIIMQDNTLWSPFLKNPLSPLMPSQTMPSTRALYFHERREEKWKKVSLFNKWRVLKHIALSPESPPVKIRMTLPVLYYQRISQNQLQSAVTTAHEKTLIQTFSLLKDFCVSFSNNQLKLILRRVTQLGYLTRMNFILGVLKEQSTNSPSLREHNIKNLTKRLLEISCEYGHLELIDFLLNQENALLHKGALINAVKCARFEVVDYLLQFKRKPQSIGQSQRFFLITINDAISCANEKKQSLQLRINALKDILQEIEKEIDDIESALEFCEKDSQIKGYKKKMISLEEQWYDKKSELVHLKSKAIQYKKILSALKDYISSEYPFEKTAKINSLLDAPADDSDNSPSSSYLSYFNYKAEQGSEDLTEKRNVEGDVKAFTLMDKPVSPPNL